jgi:hypothetical protein
MEVTLRLPPLEVSKSQWIRIPQGERALAIAIQEVRTYRLGEDFDEKEREARITAILRYAGDLPGSAWAAPFVSWCLGHAGFDLDRLSYPSSPLSWIAFARQSGALKAREPRRGDLLYIDRPGRAHLGFVLGQRGDRLATIEGDVQLDGRLGGSFADVCLRKLSDVDGFIGLDRQKPSDCGRLAAESLSIA